MYFGYLCCVYVSLLCKIQHAVIEHIVITVKCQCMSVSDANTTALCWHLPGCQDQLHAQVLAQVHALIGAFHQMSTIAKRLTSQILREKSLG